MAYFKTSFVLCSLALYFSTICGKPIDCSNAKITYKPDVASPLTCTDDSWRAQALADIKTYRKSDLHVQVTDSTGRALRDVKVRFEMKRQVFNFGTAVGVRQLLFDGDTDLRFQQIIEQNFNTLVFENDLKWPQWLTSQSNTDWNHRVTWTNQAIDWAHQRNIKVRGHTMLWGSWRWSPDSIPRDPPGLRAAIAGHIQDIGSRMSGRLMDWDVLNEPYSEHDYTDLLGWEAMVDWFWAARTADWNAKLYLNDYPNPSDNNFIQHDVNVLNFLKQNGAPVQAFGIQGHVGTGPWSIQEYQNMMNRFASTGVELAVTEYDTEISNEQTDADFLRDFMIATFAHPQMTEFLVWGFWDTAHWKGRAPFYRADWSAKPALQVYRDLVFNQWWSDINGTTTNDGSYSGRVFHGEYDIHVTKGSQTKVVKTTLNRGQSLRSLQILFD